MRKTILPMLLIGLTIGTNITLASSGELNLSTMSPKEILEFYKNNPDYGKKRLEIDYNKYIEGEYVVFRGEYKDQDGNPIKNKAINFSFNGDNYAYVSSEKGVFNLELKKDEIKPGNFYNIILKIDGYKIKVRKKGEELLEKSIFHFSIKKNSGNPHTLELETIHNSSFGEGGNFFELDLKTKKIPSNAGIQGIWLYILFGVIGLFVAFFYYNYRTSHTKKRKKTINIPSGLE